MTTSVLPDDAEIHALLVDRIDVQGNGVGVAVGVIDQEGSRVIGHGETRKLAGAPVGPGTLFEIGSITKVFTGLLLAEMAGRGEVGLDDPVAQYLPPGTRMPERGGRQITLTDLATHTSGLPRADPAFATTDPARPLSLAGQAQALADYSVDQLYGFLASYELRRDIGARYEYSNLGAGLLGHVLALRAGLDFETLLRERVTGPLGMSSTAIQLSPALRARLATAHNSRLQPVAELELTTLAGAGALRSTAEDLLAFLAAELGYARSPLQSAMARQVGVRRPTNLSRLQSALGWQVSSARGSEVVWHSGATVGSLAYLAFDPIRKVGIVVLTNTRQTRSDSIAERVLHGAPAAPSAEGPGAALPELDRYVGDYRLARGSVLSVTRDGDRLFAQLILRTSRRPVREICLGAGTRFFWREADNEVTFEVGAQGQATGLVMHWAGGDERGERLAAA